MAGDTTIEATRMRQQGANYRTGMTQSGQDRRQERKLGAEGGASAPRTATKQDVSDYAKSRGISPDEARRKFEAKGIVIR